MNAIFAALGLLVLGQAGGASGNAPHAPSSAEIQSVWDLAVKGGPMMIPIGLASFLTVAVIIERLLSLRRRSVIPAGFFDGVRSALDDDLSDGAAAIAYCRKSDSPIGDIFAAAIKRLGEPVELLEKHIQEAGERALFKLRRFLRILSVVAGVAPLMGLLGTIFGMIKAFKTVAASGEALGKAELLATGIYEAMITTAAGLLVAIPALIAYHWISARIEHLVSEMDRMTCEFIEEYAVTGTVQPKGASASVTMEDSEDSSTVEASEPQAVAAST